MFNKIKQLYADLEDYLISVLDSETYITDERAMEMFYMAAYPNEYVTYKFLQSLVEKEEK
jgi:hypothetical protein